MRITRCFLFLVATWLRQLAPCMRKSHLLPGDNAWHNTLLDALVFPFSWEVMKSCLDDCPLWSGSQQPWIFLIIIESLHSWLYSELMQKTYIMFHLSKGNVNCLRCLRSHWILFMLKKTVQNKIHLIVWRGCIFFFPCLE